jgi:hypothetical protein
MINYKTTDIILAATLRVHGYMLHLIELNGKKGTFIFEDVDQEFITDYDLGNIKVEPISFNNNIKQLTTSVRRMVTD